VYTEYRRGLPTNVIHAKDELIVFGGIPYIAPCPIQEQVQDLLLHYNQTPQNSEVPQSSQFRDIFEMQQKALWETEKGKNPIEEHMREIQRHVWTPAPVGFGRLLD
jgi:hypothetical protein